VTQWVLCDVDPRAAAKTKKAVRVKGGVKTRALPPVLLVVLALAICVSSMIGRFKIAPDVFFTLLFQPEKANGDEALSAAAVVLFEARLARVFAAVLIGGALSAAGAAYQGIFRNPMVSPDILGAATGAGFGASLAFLAGASLPAVQISAFLFGLLAVAVAYGVSTALTREFGGATLTLVLTGMVVSALFSALISIVKYVGDPYDTLPSITFWLMGGLVYVTREDVLLLLPPLVLGIAPLLLLRWRLNVLTLPDEEAGALGLRAARLRGCVVLLATLISSSSVAVGGMIGWVGLVVPHIARLLAGPDYKTLLPCSALIGAAFLLVADDAARCLFAQEIPLGVLTALAGAPFFLCLMYRSRRSFL
jgi:iron complex transport system permease protein